VRLEAAADHSRLKYKLWLSAKRSQYQKSRFKAAAAGGEMKRKQRLKQRNIGVSGGGAA